MALKHRFRRLLAWLKGLSVWIKFAIWTVIIAVFVGALGGGLLGTGNSVDITPIVEAGVQGQTGVILLGHVYNIDIPSPQNEIQATHLIEIASWHGLDPQYAYPFDTYVVDTTFLALNSDTNQSLPILDLSPADSTDNFTPYIIQQWSTRINTTGTEVDGRYLQMGFRRTILSQFFVVVLFAVNWGLTLVVLFITIAATDGQKVDVSILILPVTVILTIPALRALWVGAPAFDSVGLFVQMVVVSVCSMFLVIGIGLRSKAEQRANRDEPQEEIIEPRESTGICSDELRSPEAIPLKQGD
ncbi:hypothetical protein PHLCEN_2v3504 [Hermanssonia centrifuga]|uniref:DUF4436 domain-containing protein n=1 Tax=Hermanssonia centrifuga TaxID=98765 RepID=A0A2R6QEW7_9APHY|nr:hypothetical protein PHLCEN_2v3504 [Hermanssonia centrifuga]